MPIRRSSGQYYKTKPPKGPKVTRYAKTSTDEFKALPERKTKASGLPKATKPKRSKKFESDSVKTHLNKRLGRIVVNKKRKKVQLDAATIAKFKNARK